MVIGVVLLAVVVTLLAVCACVLAGRADGEARE
jgi:hypothetical protein